MARRYDAVVIGAGNGGLTARRKANGRRRNDAKTIREEI